MTNPKHTSSDLEAQLRTNFYAQCKEFADRIEALEAENERLRETLERIQHFSPAHMWRAPDIKEIARAALGEKP